MRDAGTGMDTKVADNADDEEDSTFHAVQCQE